MATKVEKTIQVSVPVRTAYNQWTQFEEFPQFMGGISSVTQQSDNMTHWVAEIGGVKREWDARILEQVPDTKVSWAATSGSTNAGAVYFTPVSADETSVRLELEYEPEGVVEKIGDALNVIERQAKSDLEKFKTFIESRGSESGGWRGSVDTGVTTGTPGVADAAASKGDSGAAGVSKTAAVVGGLVAAASVAAVAGVVKAKSDDAPTTTASGALSDTTGGATRGATGTASQYETIEPQPTTARDPFVEGASLTGAEVTDERAIEGADALDPVTAFPRTGGTGTPNTGS